MKEKIDSDMNEPRDVPSQLIGDPANTRVPTGSGDLLLPPSVPRFPTGSGDLLRAPTGSGNLFRPPSPQQPFQDLLFTRTKLEQLDDEPLSFEIWFRNFCLIEEITR